MEINFAQTIFAITNFLILLVAMYFLMYKPLKKTMDLRHDKIKGDIEAAESLKSDADQMKAEIRSGIINGEVATIDEINEYATIPSMEGLLTMLAGGMIEHVKNLSIALNLYAEGLEEK